LPASRSPGSVALSLDPVAAFAAAHRRFNFTVMTLDYASFVLGMSFASTATVLPAFAERLGAPNIIIGAMPAIVTVGYAVPSLLVANYAERLPRKLPFILRMGVFERLSMLGIAGAAFLLAARGPTLALAVTLLAFVSLTFFGGAIMPAWMDMFGKVMPVQYRGRQLAASSTLGAAMGVLGTLLSGYFLGHMSFPRSYGFCFLSAFAAMTVSFVFLAATREPAATIVKERMPLRQYGRVLPAILRRDRSFAWYMATKAAGALGSMSFGFYTVFALRTLAAPEWQVARFTLVLLSGQTVSSVVLGYVADRVGHKRVILVGSVAVMAANLIALAAGSTSHVYFVFLLMSMGVAAGVVSDMNLSMEFAPEAERPTYVALSMTLVAPVAFLSPLVGGLLADTLSYRAVFLVAAVAAALGVLMLWLRVAEPRGRHGASRA
ncbi:MAG: MFS transporter, partial [Anaerolineae bacterium]